MKNLFANPYLLLTLTVLFWSSNMVIGRSIRGDMPPITLAFWRWVVALALVLPLALPHLKAQWPLLRAGWRPLLALGLLGTAGLARRVGCGMPAPVDEAQPWRRVLRGGTALAFAQGRAGEGVEALELQHYEPLTLPAMRALGEAVCGRWALDGLMILHRSGVMGPAEPIVVVAAAARHRRDAFAAADYAMDHLKSESWFWKREKRAGVWHWIEPREQDYADLARWRDSGLAGA